MQVPTAVHATPLRRSLFADAGKGTLSMCQLLPSQRSARATQGWPPRPTAMQDVAETQATLSRPNPNVPAGAGIVCTDQALPSHCSARGTQRPERSKPAPTATHADLEVQTTSLNSLSSAPWRIGPG